MKYYAVIDTNVLVSAMLRWDSVPGCVLEHAFVGDIIPLLNEKTIRNIEITGNCSLEVALRLSAYFHITVNELFSVSD